MRERHVFVNTYQTHRDHVEIEKSFIDQHKVRVSIEIEVEQTLPKPIALAIIQAIRDSLLKSSLETPSSMFGNRVWMETESSIE